MSNKPESHTYSIKLLRDILYIHAHICVTISHTYWIMESVIYLYFSMIAFPKLI